jgi:S-formylglutathione hydrolase FrmB
MALIHLNFFSEALGIASSVDIIMPQQTSGQEIGLETNAKTDDLPPCLYLLHGLSDDQTIWQRRTSIERYAAAKGIAVVMPCVNRSFYTDMVYGQNYWTYVSEELPKIIHSMFKISKDPKKTFVAGLSMGGYGAIKMALRNPEKFAAAATMSGCMELKSFGDTKLNPEAKMIFGDTPPINNENDLFFLAEQLKEAGKKIPELYMVCGTEDFLYEPNQNFKKHLETLDIKHTYKEAPGTHEWGFWDAQIQDILDWLPL